LETASRVLQSFDYFPESQKPVVEKLAELRALARLVADFISKSPSVHDSYFVGDRVVSHDELARTIGENTSIFRCEMKWGHFWQDRPEDGVALYRELMSSPVFCYLHKEFWSPNLPMPRLTGWNDADRQRLPAVWHDFIQELSDSTNVLWQMEAKALTLADAQTMPQAQIARDELFGIIRAHRSELVLNNVELFYDSWGLNEHDPELEAMDQEYWQTTYAGKTPKGHLAAFDKQMLYLKNNTPYDFMQFNDVFKDQEYTKVQAAELLPLLTAYASNLTAQAEGKSRGNQGKARGDAQWIDVSVARKAREIANVPAPGPEPRLQPPAPTPAPQPPPQPSEPAPVGRVAPASRPLPAAPEVVTNVLPVNKFLEIPLDSFNDNQITAVTITAHHWYEGKLLLDFQYFTTINSLDPQSGYYGPTAATLPAIAILDPVTEHWEVIGCPRVDKHVQTAFYHRSALWHGDLFTSDGRQISKYDFQNQQWRDLTVSDADNFELFVVNDRLYAANASLIFEILDGGKSTHLLVSTRRHPPVTMLDQHMTLGTPVLFEGPGHSLRTSVTRQLFTWTGDDWHKDCGLPAGLFAPVISPDGVLFVADGFNQSASISCLTTGGTQPVLALVDNRPPVFHVANPRSDANTRQAPEPLWKLPVEFSLANSSPTLHRSDLYLLAGHSDIQQSANNQNGAMRRKVVDKDGCNAVLLRFSQNQPVPRKIFLEFDLHAGDPPLAGMDPNAHQVRPALPPAWLLFSSNNLFFASETSFYENKFRQPPVIMGSKAGVWLLPVSQLDSAIAAQKHVPPAQLPNPAVESDWTNPAIVTNRPPARVLPPMAPLRLERGVPVVTNRPSAGSIQPEMITP
jgi:hypothetical protein